jgi:hypothetical protein
LGIQVGFFNPSTIQQVVKKKKKLGSLSGLAHLVQSKIVAQPDKENWPNVVAHSDIKKKKKREKKCLLLCINVKVLFHLTYILFIINYFNAWTLEYSFIISFSINYACTFCFYNRLVRLFKRTESFALF